MIYTRSEGIYGGGTMERAGLHTETGGIRTNKGGVVVHGHG